MACRYTMRTTTSAQARSSAATDPVIRAGRSRRFAPGWLLPLLVAAATSASAAAPVAARAPSADPAAYALGLPPESEQPLPTDGGDSALASGFPWLELLPAVAPLAPALDSARGPGRTAVERDWFAGEADLTERAEALRARVRRHGMPGFDAAARALVLGEGGRPTLARARAAVALAPDLPLARAALAGALWREGGNAFAAMRAAALAVAALDSQIEASLVTRATLLSILAAALALAGFSFLAVAALATARRAAHDVGDLLSVELDARSRGLLIGALVLLPAACGQGAVGLALGCFGLVLAAGERAWRRTAFAAAALLWLGLGPVLSKAASAIASLDGDGVARAAFAVETDAASDAELARLEAAQERDPLARRALAVRAA